MLCIDIVKNKYYSLFKSDSDFNLKAADSEKALVLLDSNDVIEVHTNGEISHYGKLGLRYSDFIFYRNHELWSFSCQAYQKQEVSQYSSKLSEMVSRLKAQNDFMEIDSLLYGNNLYSVVRKYQPMISNLTYYRIISVNLNSPERFATICDNIIAYHCNEIKFYKCKNGWLFIGEKK